MTKRERVNVEQGKQGFQPTVPRPVSPPPVNELTGGVPSEDAALTLFDFDGTEEKASIVEREVLKKQMEPHGKIVLSGIVGSTAYGLGHSGSDRDRLGMFIAPTEQLLVLDDYLGSHDAPETVVFHEPSDAQFHEAGKYVRLALSCNPTATELLWLNEYEVEDSFGGRLIRLREDCLSAPRVKDAYLGYAKTQLMRILERKPEEEGGMNERRMRKHALHMARLVRQGHELYTTGQLTVKVADPGWYREFQSGTKEQWAAWFETAREKFDAASTVLPEVPRRDRLGAWLLDVRYANLPDRFLPPF